MGSQPIRLTDFGRILFGHLPWTFSIELVIRMAVIYALIVVAMRLMGKRMAAQSTRNELAALVSLAAAVGPAIQDPEAGLLPPFIVGAVVIGVQRLFAVLGRRGAKFERLTQGAMTVLVTDGVIDLVALRSLALSRARVIAQLRASAITNLGEVERMYFELNGAFTIVRATEPRPGLSLIPTWDRELRDTQRASDSERACATCGRTAPSRGAPLRCEVCGSRDAEPAVFDVSLDPETSSS